MKTEITIEDRLHQIADMHCFDLVDQKQFPLNFKGIEPACQCQFFKFKGDLGTLVLGYHTFESGRRFISTQFQDKNGTLKWQTEHLFSPVFKPEHMCNKMLNGLERFLIGERFNMN